MDYGRIAIFDPQGEMDRLIDALLAIREEIAMIERGELDKTRNPLKVRYSSVIKVLEHPLSDGSSHASARHL